MTLYDINARMEYLLEQVDEETGELLCSYEELEALALARDEKLENLALYIKNKAAEAEAIKAEKQALEKRQKAALNRAEKARDFLARMLAGEKFTTPKVAVSWRKSQAVQLDGDFLPWAMQYGDQFLSYKDPDPDKKAIAAALKAGEAVPGAELVTNLNMQIK